MPSPNQARLVAIMNAVRQNAPMAEIRELIGGDDADRFCRCSVCGSIYFARKLSYQGKPLEPACGLKCNKIVRARRAKPAISPEVRV